MSVADKIEAIERGLSDAGVTVKALCDAADINQSTWTRWKAGNNVPNMATWSRIESAFSQLAKRDAAA
jgi:predicted transcriptional regulator